MRKILTTVVILGAFSLGAVSCGSESSDSSAAADTATEAVADTATVTTDESAGVPATDVAETSPPVSDAVESVDPPTIVVTTNILGDIVADAVGELAQVEVIMPLGSDPHDFAPSARQAEAMENADLLVVNGAGFEEGMLDIIDNVADFGTPVFEAAAFVALLEGGEHNHSDEEHSDDGHSDEEHSDEEHSDEKSSGGDPHIWTDPARMVGVVEGLRGALVDVAGIDTAALDAQIDAAIARLTALDAEIEEMLEAIAPADRVLVTNHEVFAYFADRYEFEVVGAVIPSLTTNAEPSSADLEELAEVLRAEGIDAIFGETTQSSRLAEVLADEVGGDVQIVELFAESLGDDGSGAETYADMMRTNAMLIVEALSGV